MSLLYTPPRSVKPGPRHSTLDRLSVCVAGIYIMASAGLTANLLTTNVSDSVDEGGGFFLALSWIVLYALSAPLIIAALRKPLTHRDGITFLLCGLIFSGALWSALPIASIRYSFAVCSNIMFAWACSRIFGWSRFRFILQWSLNVMIVTGLLMAIAGIDTVFYHDPLNRPNLLGTALIRGLSSHKIYAGFYATVALTLNFLTLAGWHRVVWTGICLLAVLLSGSSVGLVAVVISLFVVIAIPLVENHMIRVAVLIGSTIFITVATLFWESMLESLTGALGRDITLTGRTTLWAYALQFWAEKPILGWGYGGIFGDSWDAPGRIVQVNQYYSAPHFHNGYFQIATELGTIGLMLFLFVQFRSMGRTLGKAWVQGSREDIAAAAILITISSIALVMNIGMRYNDLSTVLIFFFFSIPDRPTAKDLAASPIQVDPARALLTGRRRRSSPFEQPIEPYRGLRRRGLDREHDV